MAYLSDRLNAAETDLARIEAQTEAHHKNFSEQVEQITEKYRRINGRLSDDAVELFGICRNLVADLLNDSLLMGEANGRRHELADTMKHIARGE